MSVPEFRPDFSCAACGIEYLILGDTQLAKDRALRDWTGCVCQPEDSLATMVTSHVDAGAPTSVTDWSPVAEDHRDRASRTLPQRLMALSRLQRIPTSVRRRASNWPFDDAPDYTT